MLPADGFPRTESQRLALAARGRTKSAEGIWAHARRMADSEGTISEAKLEGTLARARCRGTPLFHVQVLVDSAAINCKRLVRHARAATGVAAAPVAAAGLAAPAVGRPQLTIRGDAVAATAAIWSFSVCLN